jgi:tricorn protease-like protein
MHRTALLFALSLAVASAQPNRGYYRYPSIHGDRILFTAEGDLNEAADGGRFAFGNYQQGCREQ